MLSETRHTTPLETETASFKTILRKLIIFILSNR